MKFGGEAFRGYLSERVSEVSDENRSEERGFRQIRAKMDSATVVGIASQLEDFEVAGLRLPS